MMKLVCLFALVAIASISAANVPATKRTYTEDENESLNRYIKALLENLKAEMPNGVPELGIPPLEPLHMPEINADIQEGIVSLRLHMLDLIMSGLSSFVVREVKGDLNTMTFALDLFLPEISGQSFYDIDGKVLIFPLYGKGMAGLKVDDLHFQGTATISIIDMKKIQLTNFDIHIVFSQIQMYLENIVGGGNLGNVVNTVINMLGKLLYDQFKDQLLPPLNDILKKVLNEQLDKIDLGDLIGGISPPATAFTVSPVQDSVNTYVDQLMENLRPYMLQNGMDPLSLPDMSTGFSKKIWFVTWRGGASISQGTLRSLSTIHRTGNFQLLQNGNRLTIDGAVGVNKMWGSFRARAWFMAISISAGIEVSVDSIRVRARINANIDQNLTADLEVFSITHVSNIGVKVSGLGPLNWILGPLATLVVNGVRGKIIQAIESPVKAKINELLKSIKMPNFSLIH